MPLRPPLGHRSLHQHHSKRGCGREQSFRRHSNSCRPDAIGLTSVFIRPPTDCQLAIDRQGASIPTSATTPHHSAAISFIHPLVGKLPSQGTTMSEILSHGGNSCHGRGKKRPIRVPEVPVIQSRQLPPQFRLPSDAHATRSVQR